MKIRQLLWMGTLALAVSACKPAETKSDTPADSTATPVVDPVPPADLPPSAALETLTGTYVTTEVGDYVHAIIKGDDKQEYSFYLADDFPEARSAEMTEGLWDGKAVKAQWRKVTRNIPEAGGDMEIDELVSIEAI
jgi:hypothetical protein